MPVNGRDSFRTSAVYDDRQPPLIWGPYAHHRPPCSSCRAPRRGTVPSRLLHSSPRIRIGGRIRSSICNAHQTSGCASRCGSRPSASRPPPGATMIVWNRHRRRTGAAIGIDPHLGGTARDLGPHTSGAQGLGPHPPHRVGAAGPPLPTRGSLVHCGEATSITNNVCTSAHDMDDVSFVKTMALVPPARARVALPAAASLMFTTGSCPIPGGRPRTG